MALPLERPLFVDVCRYGRLYGLPETREHRKGVPLQAEGLG